MQPMKPENMTWKAWDAQCGVYLDAPADAYNADGSRVNWHDYWKPRGRAVASGGGRTGGGRRGGYRGSTGTISCPMDDIAWLRRLGAGNARLGLRAMVALGRGMDAGSLRAAVLGVDPDAFGMAEPDGRIYPDAQS